MTGILGILMCQYGHICVEHLKDYEKAYTYGEEALKIVQGSNKGDCYNVMGQSKLNLGQKEEAVKYLKLGVEFFIKERPQEALEIKK